MRDAGGGSEAPGTGAGRKAWLAAKRLLPAAALAAGLIAFFALDLDRYVSLDALKTHRQALQAWVDEHGLLSALAYAAVYALAVAFSVPGAVWITIAGGFMFGPYLATLCAVAGATTGAVAVFLAARHAFSGLLRARAGPAIARMEAGFRENAASYMLVLRLVPLFPFFLVNLAAAFLGVGLRVYAACTFVGIIPGAFVYALVGDGAGAVLDAGGELDAGIVLEPRFLAPVAGLAVLACVPVVYKKLKAWTG